MMDAELEDVPLDDEPARTDSSKDKEEESVRACARAEARADWSKYLALYKRSMALAIQLTHVLTSSSDEHWTLLECDNVLHGDRVHLYEHATQPRHTIMARGIVRGRAERYAYVARDYDPATRLAWDRHDGVTFVAQRESYHVDDGYTLHYVQERVESPVMGVAERATQGVLTHYYTAEKRTHRIVFCSAGHPTWTAPVAAVPVSGVTMGVVVRQLDDGKCELTIVVQRDLYAAIGGGSIIATMWVARVKERLRERVYLFEDVVQQWDVYYGANRK